MRRALILMLHLLLLQAGATLLVRLLPGDPLEFVMAETSLDLPVEELRHEMGLDVPAWQAALQAPWAAIRGDFGRSLYSREPIAPTLAERLWASATLAAPGGLLALLIAFPWGVRAAARPRGLADRFVSAFGSLTASLPTLWIAPLAIWLFCVQLPWFDLEDGYALPILILGVLASGFWMRLVRERTREGLSLPSDQAARARGLAEWQIQLKYGLRIPLGGLLGYFALQFGHLLTGAFILEVVFNRAGMGTFFIDAILRRDYPAIEAATWTTAAICLIANFLGDQLQAWLDPRLA